MLNIGRARRSMTLRHVPFHCGIFFCRMHEATDQSAFPFSHSFIFNPHRLARLPLTTRIWRLDHFPRIHILHMKQWPLLTYLGRCEGGKPCGFAATFDPSHRCWPGRFRLPSFTPVGSSDRNVEP